MIRTVIENFLLFLLPTLLYLAWALFQRTRAEARGESTSEDRITAGLLDDAPFLWLFVGGALLVIVTLAAFGSSSGGKPGQHYQPSVLKDGQIQPSHIE
ncbi:hypothetical protein [Hyphomicrobium sp.]|uniref:hypothetical protein n=1 Tax=Hyphomicrobium sp. TaxID=82 RepID=UPI002E32E194|nr:hypothetical protein [Hyphomicrobium sp.]HEX2840378.1 hypothetical protein [Hyphomicrobium sp.]